MGELDSGSVTVGSDIHTFCSSFQSYAFRISSSREAVDVVEKVVLLGRVEGLSDLAEDDDDADEVVVAVEAVAGLGSWARMISRTFSFCWIKILTCSSVY